MHYKFIYSVKGDLDAFLICVAVDIFDKLTNFLSRLVDTFVFSFISGQESFKPFI